jgi:hypothetical protein
MIRSTLDAHWDKAWRKSPYRLRFELGGEEFSNITQPVPRFLQAFDRSRAIADAVFPEIEKLTAIVAATDDAPFHALSAMGFPTEQSLAAWRAPYWPDDHEVPDFSFRAYQVANTVLRDVLIWASITQEMSVTPKAHARIHLIDQADGVDLLIHDDRGMDVQAAHAESIALLYRRFDAWLLDHDRPRLTALFGP